MKATYNNFSRRGPDTISEELATVLRSRDWFEFKALFDIVHSNLRARNAVNGGEEMLRLRAYDKLQNLVSGGIVEKASKKYRGVTSALEKFFEKAAGLKTKLTAERPAAAARASEAPFHRSPAEPERGDGRSRLFGAIAAPVTLPLPYGAAPVDR